MIGVDWMKPAKNPIIIGDLVKIGELNLKREWKQIAKISLGNVSSLHLAKESDSHLESNTKVHSFSK